MFQDNVVESKAGNRSEQHEHNKNSQRNFECMSPGYNPLHMAGVFLIGDEICHECGDRAKDQTDGKCQNDRAHRNLVKGFH